MQQAQVTEERWLPVPDWGESYEVSDLGRTRSIDRWVERKDGRRHPCRGRVLVQAPDKAGYLCVQLHRGGRHVKVRVHLLVLVAFAGPRPPGQQARHGPGGQQDNRLVNLCWGTAKENQADRLRDGTSSRGEQHGIAKLTEAIVRECRSRYAAGESHYALAREFGVESPTMHRAIHGLSWAHVDSTENVDNEERRLLNARGDRHPQSKLTEAIVRECRRRYAAGESQRALADEFGVCQQGMSNAIQGKSWKHVT